MLLIAIFILSISQSYANPIPNSGSGSEFDFMSGDDSGSGIHKNNHYNDAHHTCDTSCKVFTYILITILCSCLACLCGLFILIVYEACIKNIIRTCVKNIKKNCRYYKENYCISCGKHTSRDNQCVENQNFQNNELSYYDKFIIMYNSMYKKEKHLNSECPICLGPIKKDFYTLHCKHAYHTQCMKQYINSDEYKQQCALCRNTIDV